MNLRLFILSVIILFTFPLHSSQDSIPYKLLSYVDNIDIFNRLLPQEKVYLHFDNTGYFRGDTIWFKAYVTDTGDDVFDVSKVLYIDIIASEGTVFETKKIKIEKGQSHGFFLLKEDYHSGFYEIRAYTRYMLNWGRDYIFSRVFPVYDKPEIEGNYEKREMEGYTHLQERIYEREKPKKQKDVNIDFYPEGGDLVENILSRIAIKVTGKSGEPLSVTGSVYNKKGEAIQSFGTIYQGMGVFEFTPQSESYYVEILYNEKKYKFDLPKAIQQGYCMRVNSQDDNIKVWIQKSLSLSDKILGVSIINKGRVLFFEAISFDDNELLLEMSKNILDGGVNQITLFDKKGEIYSERLFFVYPEDKREIELLSEQKVYKPFELIKLNFHIDGGNNHTSFSLAIRDKASDINDWEENIYSNLLLSSDLKGHIENPSYYFQQDVDGKRESAINLLMMVQGWRRYEWSQMAGIDRFLMKHPKEKDLMLNGRIESINNDKKEKGQINNIDINVFCVNRDDILKDSVKTDEKGFFTLLFDDFRNTSRLILNIQQPTYLNERGKIMRNEYKYKIMLDRVFNLVPRAYSFFDTNVKIPDYNINNSIISEETTKDEKNDISKIQLLPQVVVSKKVKNKVMTKLTYDVDRDKRDLMDQGKKFPKNVLHYLTEKGVPLIYDDSKTGGEGWICHNIKINFLCSLEQDLKNINYISIYDDYYAHKNFNFSKAKKIEGPRVTIASQTYNKYKPVDSYDNVNVRNTIMEGFSVAKKFYNPDYEKYPPIPGDVDYRRTLYWNPNVKTDENGNASVSFYNNSSYSKITVSAEGMTNDGEPIAYEEK